MASAATDVHRGQTVTLRVVGLAAVALHEGADGRSSGEVDGVESGDTVTMPCRAEGGRAEARRCRRCSRA